MPIELNERPHENEKKKALMYINQLLEKARGDRENRNEDIIYLQEIQRLLNSKKYGLVWEEHAEQFEEDLQFKIPVFLEEENKKINNQNDSPYNFILEGDNLHSLYLLEKTHMGKIDIIYIDPPYNTGNHDFLYNDDWVKQDDEFKHSKWLSFMERRLKIAKRLLSPNGIIFISIDNKEGYQLKLLLDEIFGENQMAADLHVETSAVAGPRRFAAVNGSVVKTTEFIFAYTKGSKAIMKRPLYDGIVGFDTHYSLFEDETGAVIPLVDEINKSKKLVAEFKNSHLKVNMPNLNKLIQVNPIIRDWIYQEEISKHIFRSGDAIKLNEEELTQLRPNSVTYLRGKYLTLNKNGTPIVLFRYFDRLGMSDDYSRKYGERTIRGNLWKGFSADGGNLASEGGVSFKNGKKPKRLIKQLIKSSTLADDKVIVLDFFAGSGTTGQAVMELNNEKAGNYQFILATNDEVIDTTYKRMENVNKDFPMNLKYFKTAFVEKNDEDLEHNLLNNIESLVELAHGIDLSKSDVAIVTSKSELENLDLTGLSIIYMRSQTHKMLDRTQIVLLKDIKIIDIPETFFSREMREVGL